MICYHGTTAENAASIRRAGFYPDSWFAFEREHALAVGGPVVLEVEFPDGTRERLEGLNPDIRPFWQFHVPDAVPAARIAAQKSNDRACQSPVIRCSAAHRSALTEGRVAAHEV